MSKKMRREISQRIRNGEDVLSGNARPLRAFPLQQVRRAKAASTGFRGLAAPYKVSPYLHWLINKRGGLYS